MKNRILSVALSLIPSLVLNSQSPSAFAQGTAFTYQGRLTDTGNPANGSYDIRARLFNADTGGIVIAGPLTNSAVTITNGLFAVPLDFGAVFDGTVYWLQISVRTNGGGGFNVLSPRQQLTPAPYAIFSTTASNMSGTLPASQLSGVIPSADLSGIYTGVVSFNNAGDNFVGNGVNLLNVNAAELGGLNAGNFWQLGGNFALPGQFIGTTNNQPLDFYAAGVRAMRLRLNADGSGIYSNAPTVISGSSVNSTPTSVVGATIAGGGGNASSDGTAYPNKVTSNFGTVGGGAQNTAGGTGEGATVSGGEYNTASSYYDTVGGGYNNIASGGKATVSGGVNNTASGFAATVSGGGGNLASGAYSFAAGLGAQAIHGYSFVWSDGETITYSSDREAQFKVQAGFGMVLDVSASSGLNPAAFKINSTSANGIALWATQGSSDSTAVLANSGSGDIIKGYSGPSAGNLVFEVQNDGTVISKGVVLTSDRNAKANFTPLDGKSILEKVIAMPVTEWNYKDDAANKKHIGPVAQDFHAAFGLDGDDTRHISIVDESGVALAAIQGLNEKVEVKSEMAADRIQKSESKIEKLEVENAELKLRLNKLEQLIAGSREKNLNKAP